MMFSLSRAAIVAAGLALSAGCAPMRAHAERVIAPLSYAREASPRLAARVSFVSLPVSHGERTWHTAGILSVPYAAHDGPRPAVVIVHGSNGVDSRGGHYAEALNRAGFVTLEIDLWAPRGVRSPAERPRSVRETLPDAFAALAYLKQQAGEVDGERVGIMGFSWGGVVSMLTATRANRAEFATGDQGFAAHAPLYPVCWVYNRVPGYDFTALTGAPVLIQAGDADTYDAPGRCETLRASLPAEDRELVSVRVYPAATHGWERREPDAVANDPYSHEGAGGETPIRYNEAATRASTRAVIDFFQTALAAADE
jgi:dienelactone hydrolase